MRRARSRMNLAFACKTSENSGPSLACIQKLQAYGPNTDYNLPLFVLDKTCKQTGLENAHS